MITDPYYIYNEDPVEYCTECLSLLDPVEQEFEGYKVEVCPVCGNTIFGRTSIFEWISKFEKKYKCNPLNTETKWKTLMEKNK